MTNIGFDLVVSESESIRRHVFEEERQAQTEPIYISVGKILAIAEHSIGSPAKVPVP
jgi:hypothetical protein